MARLPYRTDEDAGPAELVATIRARRRGELMKLDRLLLHSPPFAEGWNGFLGTVIEKLSLPERDSQFVMCLIGVLNGADYELASHAPKFIAAGGTQAQLDALSDTGAAAADEALFSESERAIIGLTVEMTRDVAVSNAGFTRARAAMRDDREMIDLIGLIATYNMVSRFVVALDVHADDGRL